jgi:GntR family transcriptional regulator
MYITLDETDRRPFYRQVVDEIKALIAKGELLEGSTLPPVRQVASDLGVNLNTVAFAYRKLQQEGLVQIKHGSGAIVTSRVLGEKSNDHLRTQLRTALTHLMLAGLKPSEIKSLVDSELKELVRA